MVASYKMGLQSLQKSLVHGRQICRWPQFELSQNGLGHIPIRTESHRAQFMLSEPLRKFHLGIADDPQLIVHVRHSNPESAKHSRGQGVFEEKDEISLNVVMAVPGIRNAPKIGLGRID